MSIMPRKISYQIAMLILLSMTTSAQSYLGPIPQPTSGYGAPGPYPLSKITFTNPYYINQYCEILYPNGVSGTVPTIFYLHGFGANFSMTSLEFFIHLASHGYAVVFVPYPTTILIQQNYDIMLNGFKLAAKDYSHIIDTTRVGFVGYSFGGGAAFYVADNLITDLGWGSNGRFITTVAPWYSFSTTNTELDQLPSDTKLLTFVMENDEVCDHRQAIDLFVNTPTIPFSEKDYVYIRESDVGGYVYSSDHLSFATAIADSYDALDAYVYHRLITALADYTFTGNPGAKNIALGGGSSAQTTLPTGMTDLIVTDAPEPNFPSSNYIWPCDSFINPRSAYCNSLVPIISPKGDRQWSSEHDVGFQMRLSDNTLKVFNAEHLRGEDIYIIDALGSIHYHEVFKTNEHQINISRFPASVYFVRVGGHVRQFTNW